MNMFFTLLLNEYHKKSGKKHVIWVRFIDDIFFIWTDGIDLLKEILPFCQKYSETKNMKSVIKLEISKSTKTINFLDVFITLKQLTLSTTVFPKSADAHICLNLISCHPNIWANTSQSHNSYVSIRFVPIHLITSRKVNSNFFIKQDYESSKLKMYAKDMLAKTRDTKRHKLLQPGIKHRNIYHKYLPQTTYC